ncbi:MAG: hypothetical protein ACMXYK_00900, partial [Candidatus Woesearchaeota archaeon]
MSSRLHSSKLVFLLKEIESKPFVIETLVANQKYLDFVYSNTIAGGRLLKIQDEKGFSKYPVSF